MPAAPPTLSRLRITASALVMVAILLMIPSVSAIETSELISESITQTKEYFIGYGGQTDAPNPHNINTATVIDIQSLKSAPIGLICWPPGGISHDPYAFSAQTACTYSVSGVTIGTGTVGYYIDIDSGNNYVFYTFDEETWDVSGVTTGNNIAVTYDDAEVSNMGFSGAGRYAYGTPGGEFVIGTGKSGSTLIGNYQFNMRNVFKHEIIVNGDIDEQTVISVNRVVDSLSYQSTVRITGGDKTSPFYNGNGVTDVSVTLPGQDQPYRIEILSTLTGKYYNRTYFDTDEPGSGSSDNSSVNVYIQNAQTGALLADAHIEIRDTTTEPWTEVVNQTLTSGQGIISLPKDTGIHLTQYRIGATVPGYQQVVTALFFRVTGPTNVVVEMEPVEGGPVNEDNAYLEFYVRDLNANGIPNANVLVDGQLRWTNAQGYTQIEVAKNASYPYSVSKSGYVTIEGTATVADGPRYVVNVVLGPGTVPTYTPGPGETPGGPGATPTPDRRTNEEKGQAIIDLIADFAEPIALLAIVATVSGLMQMMMPRRR